MDVLVCAGTVEWLPGQPLGNDRRSWSDELVGLPNIYVYSANNPSESILAKRRGYGTIVSYNVPPYGRAGLYLELANLKELVDEYRTDTTREGVNKDLCQTIYDLAQRSGMTNDVPLLLDPNDKESALEGPDLPKSVFEEEGLFASWVLHLSDYLNILQDRLFSSGLRYAEHFRLAHQLSRRRADYVVKSRKYSTCMWFLFSLISGSWELSPVMKSWMLISRRTLGIVCRRISVLLSLRKRMRLERERPPVTFSVALLLLSRTFWE